MDQRGRHQHDHFRACDEDGPSRASGMHTFWQASSQAIGSQIQGPELGKGICCSPGRRQAAAEEVALQAQAQQRWKRRCATPLCSTHAQPVLLCLDELMHMVDGPALSAPL